MPIYMADPFVEWTIRRITGDDKTRMHLKNLGFIEGEPVMVINKVDDNVILKIKGVSLAITNELAKRIYV